jgi:hypothetical protein
MPSPFVVVDVVRVDIEQFTSEPGEPDANVTVDNVTYKRNMQDDAYGLQQRKAHRRARHGGYGDVDGGRQRGR